MNSPSLIRVAAATLGRQPLAWTLSAALVLMALASPQPVALGQADASEGTAAQQPAPAGEQPPATPAEEEPAAPGETPAAGEQAVPSAEEPAAPAQEPAAEQPAASDQPTAAAEQAPAAAALTPAVLGQGQVTMNFKDASLSTVLNYLSEAAGLVIIPEVPVDGPVSIVALTPMSVDEAISSLNTALKQNGFAAIRMDNTLKIVTLDAAKTAGIPVRTGSNPLLVPQTDEVVTWVIPVRYCDAPRLASDLAGLIPSYALLTANASSNSLIMTGTCMDIRRIVEIVHALDTQQATVAEVRVFRLEYANAQDAANLINQVFQQEDQRSSQQQRAGIGPGMFFQRGGSRGGNQQQQQEGTRGPRVLAAADSRTNTLVVSGPADTLTIIEGVVQDLDSNPAEEEAVLVYALKNSQAENLTTVLNQLFQQSTTQTTGGRAGGRTGGFFSRLSQQQQQSANQALAGLTGTVYVVADADTNSLLIRTPPKNFDLVRTIIQQLDRPVPQVLIKVLVAEVTHSNTVDLGVEFSALNLAEGENGTALLTDLGVAAQTQGLIYKMVHGDTTAILRALEDVGKLEILSRPYILASDNQLATITVGDEVPFIQNTRTTDTGQTINTITYEDIGIILNVTPQINPEGLVIMDISPEISSISGTSVPISETVSAPVFAKRSATSRVAIRDGQTIVIGGLIEDSKTSTIKQVPILGDIPLLGALFRRTKDEKTKTELLIFLTPHVAHIADDLESMSQDELNHTQIVPDAVRPGAFQKQLEGMQVGGSQNGKEQAPAAAP